MAHHINPGSDNQIKSALRMIEEIGLDIEAAPEILERCSCILCRRHVIADILISIEARGYKVVKQGT